MKQIFFLCLFFLSISQLLAVEEDKMADIAITVHNIKSLEGSVRIAVYNRADHFNKEPIYAFAFPKDKQMGGQLLCRFRLPAGDYAFSLLDDKNDDNAMSFSTIGIPKEGFGFSNDAKIGFLRGPKFKHCQVKVASGKVNSWRIKMRYI
ncbi:MAG: DUF2141 domain-containing protein [Saprospiraceae bacterium]|nr:DUF2141 domain-containing protein [Saprospiraceae bacterium]